MSFVEDPAALRWKFDLVFQKIRCSEIAAALVAACELSESDGMGRWFNLQEDPVDKTP